MAEARDVGQDIESERLEGDDEKENMEEGQGGKVESSSKQARGGKPIYN